MQRASHPFFGSAHRAGALVAVVAALLSFTLACSDDSSDANGTQTGISGVDATTDAVLAGDPEALTKLIIFRDEPCLAPDEMGLGGLPCEDQEAPDTIVSAFPAAACEGYWVREAAIDSVVSAFVAQVDSLFAVVESPAVDPPDSFPLGDHWVVFAGSINGQPVGLLAVVEDERIASLQTACGTGPETYLTYRGETLPIILATASD